MENKKYNLFSLIRLILAILFLPIAGAALIVYMTFTVIVFSMQKIYDLFASILNMRRIKPKRPEKSPVKCSCGCGGFLTTSDLLHSDMEKLSCTLRKARELKQNKNENRSL